MAKVLVVSDAQTVTDDVLAVADDGENVCSSLRSGELVRKAVETDPPDIVVADCQVQSMGGIAVCLDLKLEESGGRLPHVPVLLLLDRRADVFLARRSGAEGFLVKPLDPIRLRHAMDAVLAGGVFHDTAYTPVTVAADS